MNINTVRILTIKNCIEEASYNIGRLDSIVLLSYAIGREKEFVLTHSEYQLSGEEAEIWKEVLNRRARGEPVAYITGYKEFYSLRFSVNRSTLIPRPETEHLVDQILIYKPSIFLDVGTGCGNIAISVKYYFPDCNVIAVDISDEALDVAKGNARTILGAPDQISFYHGNFFEPIPRGIKFDIIASNPPYIKRGEVAKLPREVRCYEPVNALDGGDDGLEAYREILRGARKRLNRNGRLILEVDEAILDGFFSLTRNMEYKTEKLIDDYAGKPRVVVLS